MDLLRRGTVDVALGSLDAATGPQDVAPVTVIAAAETPHVARLTLGTEPVAHDAGLVALSAGSGTPHYAPVCLDAAPGDPRVPPQAKDILHHRWNCA